MRAPTWPPDAPPARTRALATARPNPAIDPNRLHKRVRFASIRPLGQGKVPTTSADPSPRARRRAARAALSGSGLDIERPLEPLGHVRLVDADELRQPFRRSTSARLRSS